MNHRQLLLGTLITFASALAACGGSVDLDENGAGGTGAGGAATGGTATGGTATGGTATGGTSYGGTGGWAYAGTGGEVTGGAPWGGEGGTNSCDAYRNEPVEPIDYKIRVVNKRAHPVYFGPQDASGCSEEGHFSVNRYGSRLAIAGGGCGSSCQQVMDFGPVLCGACMSPAVIRLDPGGVLEGSWDGTHWENQLLPAACSGYGDWNCQRQVPTPLDGITVLATAWADISCPDGTECACSDPSGACPVFGAEVTGSATPQEVEFVGGVATITFYDPLL